MHYNGELKWGWWWAAILSHRSLYYNLVLAKDLGSPGIEIFIDLSQIKIGIEFSFTYLALRLGVVHLAIQWGK